MDIRQLRYFVAIAEAGSVSNAAQRVHIAQPSLSQHIRQMEAELGAMLFVRGPRGVVPTEAGELLLQHARIILGHFEAAHDEIRGSQIQPAGEVRFGLSPTVAQILSVPLIEESSRRYPLIRICLAEAMSGYLLDWLREGRVSLAIIYRQSEAQNVTCRHVLTEEMSLIGPADAVIDENADGTVDFAKVGSKPLILPGPSHGLRSLIDEVAASEKVELDVRIEMDAFTQIKVLCSRGHGFSILPTVAVSDDVRAGRLKAWGITNPPLTRNLYMAYRMDHPLSNAAVAVNRLCGELIAKLVRNGDWPATLPPGHAVEEPLPVRIAGRPSS